LSDDAVDSPSSAAGAVKAREVTGLLTLGRSTTVLVELRGAIGWATADELRDEAG
jgi:hypothetical protein